MCKVFVTNIFRTSGGSVRQESLINIDHDEEDDDLIYECPGLAPHGEMEVTNPFFLEKDRSKRHATNTEVKRTVAQSSEIPFLRTQIDPMKLSKTHHGTFMGQYFGNNQQAAATQAERAHAIKL